MSMWKAEFRTMTGEERAELRRILGNHSASRKEGVGSWLGRLFDRGRESNDFLREALIRDLQCGKAQVIHATAADAIRLANPDGSLAGFFVDIGNGLVMFIESREWDTRAAGSDFESLFPCSRFTLVRAPHSGVDLEFRCEGPAFDATREIEAPSLDVLDAFIEDGEIMPGRLESLEDDFERLMLRSRLVPARGSRIRIPSA
jgi:hypothetical protein